MKQGPTAQASFRSRLAAQLSPFGRDAVCRRMRRIVRRSVGAAWLLGTCCLPVGAQDRESSDRLPPALLPAEGSVSIRMLVRPKEVAEPVPTFAATHNYAFYPVHQQSSLWNVGTRKLPQKPGMPELPLLALDFYAIPLANSQDNLALLPDAELKLSLDEPSSVSSDKPPVYIRKIELVDRTAETRQAELQLEDPPSADDGPLSLDYSIAGDSPLPEQLNDAMEGEESQTAASESDSSEFEALDEAVAARLQDDSGAESQELAALIRDRGSNELVEGSECPGGPGSDTAASPSQPDDIPLVQDEHPYYAPVARSDEEAPPALAPEVTQLTARQAAIRVGIANCLEYFLTHQENTTRRGPWALMHTILPFGVETEIIAGNQRVNAIGWLCFNGVCAKQRMFQPTKQGFRTNLGPGVQGHEGQFLAILAQSKVRSDYPLQIGSRRYTIQDLVKYEMATCREKSELTFKLIGLSHYLQPEQRWRDNRGGNWNLEKMVAEELAQPIVGAACGGSHRLMGLSYAVIQRQKSGQPLTGNWARAEQYLNDYVSYAMSLQNPDGSFSTEWFEARGMDPDVERRIQTTGHILEWLIYTLPDEHLHSPQIELSLEFLLRTLAADPARDWPIGPRGHALRAMALYSQRVFDAEPGRMKTYVASELQRRSTTR